MQTSAFEVNDVNISSAEADRPHAAGLNATMQRRAARPFAVYLFIWGGQWTLAAALEFMKQWLVHAEPLQRGSVGLALALTALAAAMQLRRKRRETPGPGDAAAGARSPVLSALAAPLLCAAALLALWLYLRAASDLLLPLARGVLLTAGYALAGLRLGKPLLLLSAWTLALTATVGVAYYGYAGILVGGFGGLSLIAAGYMLILWSKGARRA